MEEPKTIEERKYERLPWYVTLILYTIWPIALVMALTNKSWTKSTKHTFLWLIFFWPYGLYYMLKKSDWTAGSKRAIVGFYILGLLLGMGIVSLVYFDNKNATNLRGSTSGPMGTGFRIYETKNWDAQELHLKAKDSYSKGNYEEALDYILEAEEIEPTSDALQSYKCLLLVENYYLSEALTVCEKVYEEHPNNPYVASNLALGYYLNGDCDRVLKITDEMLDIRLGFFFSDEERSLFAGNAGIYISGCDGDSELAEELLQKAILWTSSPDDKANYQEYIINLK